MNNQTKKPPMGGMGPSKGPMSVEKAKDFKGTTKKLLNNYLSNYYWYVCSVDNTGDFW